MARVAVDMLNVQPGGAVRVAAITFSDNATLEFQLDAYNTTGLLREALYFRSAGGKTNTQDALRLAYESVFTPTHGDRRAVHNVAIVVTDGQSNVQPDRTIPEADAARQRGIEIFAVAVGEQANMAEIDGLANDPNSQHEVILRTVNDVTPAASALIELLCHIKA
jgi:collagen type VI alpha